MKLLVKLSLSYNWDNSPICINSVVLMNQEGKENLNALEYGPS